MPVESDADQTRLGWLVLVFLPTLTAMVGYWATLSLNIRLDYSIRLEHSRIHATSRGAVILTAGAPSRAPNVARFGELEVRGPGFTQDSTLLA